jgi:hypothetical protein
MGPVTGPLAKIAPEYLLFGGAGLLSLIAFVGLILVPTLGSFGRVSEKLAASFVTVFMLITLVLIGIALGLVIVWKYDDLTGIF